MKIAGLIMLIFGVWMIVSFLTFMPEYILWDIPILATGIGLLVAGIKEDKK